MGVFESEHDMCISIHALLAESDQTNGSTTIPNFNFYPRSPCGERPKLTEKLKISSKFLSTLSLRRATNTRTYRVYCPAFLSTLSLRRATRQNYECFKWIKFLSTLSLRRATGGSGVGSWPRVIFLSTLSLRRATLQLLQCGANSCISIHALLAESDAGKGPTVKGYRNFYPRSPCGERLSRASRLRRLSEFLSTLSLRRATIVSQVRKKPQPISIHALLAESDCVFFVV